MREPETLPARAQAGNDCGRLSSSWNSEEFAKLVEAARDKSRVSGLTHNFYRYPARFSPKFVRRVIEQFTEPGDLIFDPFMGGGTTIVEAISLGRSAIGTDISSLATFVSQAKTLIFSDKEFLALERWTSSLGNAINILRSSPNSVEYAEAGYHRHLGSSLTWRLRKAIEQVLTSAETLPSRKLETFARCVALRAGQWALDGRKQLPTIEQFRQTVCAHAIEMLIGARELRDAVSLCAHHSPTATCLNKSAIGLDPKHCGNKAPRLVLTSPPYPGVHVLYHRWQVDGRKETAAPFWIANRLDGSGASYYTLGDRHAPDNRPYFEGIAAALSSVSRICDKSTMIVQLVAFSDPARQLPRYLATAESAGLREVDTPLISENADGRLWRLVPNRKWHADRLGQISASKEVVLFHRVA